MPADPTLLPDPRGHRLHFLAPPFITPVLLIHQSGSLTLYKESASKCRHRHEIRMFESDSFNPFRPLSFPARFLDNESKCSKTFVLVFCVVLGQHQKSDFEPQPQHLLPV